MFKKFIHIQSIKRKQSSEFFPEYNVNNTTAFYKTDYALLSEEYEKAFHIC